MTEISSGRIRKICNPPHAAEQLFAAPAWGVVSSVTSFYGNGGGKFRTMLSRSSDHRRSQPPPCQPVTPPGAKTAKPVASAMSKMNGRGLAHVFGRAGHLANSCAKPVDLRGHRQRPVPASVTSKLNTLAAKPFHWLTIFEFGDVADGRGSDVLQCFAREERLMAGDD